MKRLSKLVILAAILLALLVAYLIITLVTNKDDTPDNGDTTTTDQINTSYTAAQIDISTMYALKYTVSSAEYSFTLSDDKTAWLWSEDETIPLDNGYFASMASAIQSVSSDVKLKVDLSELGTYGLDQPWLTVTVSDDTYGTQTFTVGSLNSFNGKYYFRNKADASYVYMVDSALPQAFVYTPYQMVKHDSLPDIASDAIKKITVSETDNRTTYTYYESGKDDDPATDDLWYVSLKEDDQLPADQALAAILPGLYDSISLDTPAGYTAERRSALGLDTPTELTFTYSEQKTVTDANTGASTSVTVDKDFTLLLGYANGDGNVYVGLKDSVLAYLVDGSALTQIFNAVVLPST